MLENNRDFGITAEQKLIVCVFTFHVMINGYFTGRIISRSSNMWFLWFIFISLCTYIKHTHIQACNRSYTAQLYMYIGHHCPNHQNLWLITKVVGLVLGTLTLEIFLSDWSLELGASTFMKITRSLFDWEVAVWLRKPTPTGLSKCNAN